MSADPRSRMPRTDAVLADPRLVAAVGTLGKGLVLSAVRSAQERARRSEIPPEDVVEAAVAGLPDSATSLRRVLNATGVVVHTNLGRAPLSAAAVRAMSAAAGNTDVELDLASGLRGTRGKGALSALAAAVPEAGAVHVVNNCASALVLVATAVAQNKEIVISRGELVEIGDGFRIPELLGSTGARMVEVGTTNRTTVSDYRDALGPETGCILKVHPSNFTVRGFTAEAAIHELASLGPPVVADIGSGLLTADPRLPGEPDASSTLRAGADLVVASGDKLLGGPQCGLILGDEALVHRLRRHPIARALRVDKLTLAALEATLQGPRPPVREMLEADPTELRARAERLLDQLPDSTKAEVVPSESVVGGGGAPGQVLESAAISVPVALAEPLRHSRPPVVARVEDDRCLLDLRTVDPGDDERLVAALCQAVEEG